ncbi:Aste57867_8229 [Aphanomyces stellatus]|uniref:Aste57867_8229 protein n=1 Tax=Aphanomyces stellatus TaxID=120398 RepID=A0A485KJR3_9STRA|nr:hypothetical protein As57867_008198 [Aphanomyces stellatus]VFT85116.1 Aste57867_8229 [Aphanomyces stellatus]
MANPQYSYAMPNASQLELDSLEELDEFDYDPNFFDGISFNKKEGEASTINVAAPAPPHYLRQYPESPSPSLTGYTSEESGYSSTLSVDDNHGGKWSPTSDASNGSKRTTINDGTMTNGKTSLYRGVTRTSKTAWGAKYSSKRIVNTCKTQEEAARKYDEYIKVHVPEKYLKYANFCPKCDKYTNSLGLTWATKECQCTAADAAGSFVSSVGPSSSMEHAALEDFLKDEQIDLSSPYFTDSAIAAAHRTSSLHARRTDSLDSVVPMIKAEPNIPMLRSSSSMPDDDVLAAILNAPAMPQPNMFGSFQGDDDAMLAMVGADGDDPRMYLTMETVFLRKYFRNDRKNLQCFPYCREHGNYYEAKMNGLEHTGKGVCRAPVKVKVHHPHGPPSSSHLIVLARCQRKHAAAAAAIPGELSPAQLQEMQAATWVRGTTSDATADDTTVYFLPEVWKFDGELPKKRRLDESDDDDLQYCVQVVLFVSENGGASYVQAGGTESNLFDIQSTRTLLRQKQRKDGDDVMLVGGLPAKKKICIPVVQNYFRESRGMSLLHSTNELDLIELDLESVEWAKEGEAIDIDAAPISSTKKKQIEVEISPAVDPPSTTLAAPFTSIQTPKPDHKPTEASDTAAVWKERFVAGPLLYSAMGIPVGLVCLVAHLILLPFIWLGAPICHFADGVADMDLYLANSMSPPEEPHVLLHHLAGASELLGRVGHYVLVKVPLTLVALVGCLVLTVLALVAIVVPPLSRGLRVGANSCGMIAIDACKGACGQKLTPVQLHQPTPASHRDMV